MPTWIESLLKWIEENRPSELEHFKTLFDSGLAPDSIILLAHVGFEAGRKYQHDNPDAELGPID